MNNTQGIAIAVILLIVLLGGVMWWRTADSGPSTTSTSTAATSTISTGTTTQATSTLGTGTTAPTPNPTTPTLSAGVTSIKIALLDYEGTSTGVQRGCDKVVMVNRTIPATKAPLTAALRHLFGIEQTDIDGWHNFIARTNDTLKFDHATIENGVASIYITGQLSGLAGVCDDPRAKTQIEETALQFPTVQRVVLYLNGTQTTLQPDQRGEQ